MESDRREMSEQLVAQLELARQEQQGTSQALSQLATSIDRITRAFTQADSDGKSAELSETVRDNALAVIVTLLSQSLPEMKPSQLSHLMGETVRRQGETAFVQASPQTPPKPAFQPITPNALPAKPKPMFKAPQPGSTQDVLLEWMLAGASGTEEGDWFIKRVLDEDESLSVSVVWNAAKKANIDVGRATVGRLYKSIRAGDYNSHIAQRCEELDIPIANVFPGKSPKAEFTGNAWKITDG